MIINRIADAVDYVTLVQSDAEICSFFTPSNAHARSKNKPVRSLARSEEASFSWRVAMETTSLYIELRLSAGFYSTCALVYYHCYSCAGQHQHCSFPALWTNGKTLCKCVLRWVIRYYWANLTLTVLYPLCEDKIPVWYGLMKNKETNRSAVNVS